MRHGETESNQQDRFTSRTDVPLSALGAEHVSSVAVGMASLGIDRVFCSPAKRARQTAEIVRESLSLVSGIDVVDELKEIDFGEFEGMRREDLEGDHATRARIADWFNPYGPGTIPPGGEPWEAAAERASKALEFVSASDAHTLVVGHGYLLRLMIVGALELGSPPMIRRFVLGNARLSVLSRSSGHWRLVAHNFGTIATEEDLQ